MFMIKGESLEPSSGLTPRREGQVAISGRVAEPSPETVAQKRRRERLALIEEFGGPAANLKAVAVEAMRRGMYSPRTNPGDVELCLHRTWVRRKRKYSRD